MSELIDEIIRMIREIPKPECTRIIIVRHGIPQDQAILWKKHGGILWVNEKMWTQIPNVGVSHTRASSLLGIDAEYYTSIRHGDLWVEFLVDHGRRYVHHNID